MTANDRASELLQKAVQFAKRNELEQARVALSELLDIEPEHPVAAGMLAAVYVEMKTPEKAIEYYEAAVRFNPENLLARFQLGLVFLDLARPQDALNAWSMGDYGINEYLVNFYKGVALARLDRAKEALTSFRQSQEFMPVDHALYPELLSHLIHLSH